MRCGDAAQIEAQGLARHRLCDLCTLLSLHPALLPPAQLLVFSGVLAGGSQANSLRNSPSSQLAFALLSNLSNLFHGNFHGCETNTGDLKAHFLCNFLISNLHPADLEDSLEIITFPL